MDDFKKFAEYKENAIVMGLEETASIICWDKFTVMDSDLFDTLFEESLRETRLRLGLKND